MIDIVDHLRRTLPRSGRQRTIRECRRCGTTVDGDANDCSTCGSDEIAHYDL